MILYSGRDKTLFYPFFYDLDASFSTDSHFIDVLSYWDPEDNIENDPLWSPLFNLYRDEIHQRYTYVRERMLNKTYIDKLLDYAYSIIPEEWFIEEQNKWGNAGEKLYPNTIVLDDRLRWLDKNIFNIEN